MAWSGSFLVLSILVHLILIGGATVLIVQVVQAKKEKLKFTAAPPSPAGPAEHKVKPTKKTAAAAPAVSKRITSTAINASVALPAMDLNASTSPDLMAGVMSGMGASGLGAGAGTGAGAGMASMPLGGLTAFGFKGKTTDGLTGTFYDLKQTSDQKPTDMAPTEDEKNFKIDQPNWRKSKENLRFGEVLKQFVSSNWDPKILDAYFKAPEKMSAYQIAFTVASKEGPKAFGVDKWCTGLRWVVHYKGSFVSPKDGQFRFVGFGDDILIVRIRQSGETSGKNVLDASPLKQFAPEAQSKDSVGDFFYKAGPWFTLQAGQRTEIEILVGEWPGGSTAAFLGVEDRSAPNPMDDYPVFQLKDIPIPDKKSSIFPRKFSGTKMVFAPKKK